MTAAQDKFIRLIEVENIVGLKTSSLYAMIKRQEFPAPIKIGAASRWSLNAVSAWMAEKSAA